MLKNIKISRQNKGITLITLVITIIVLLILAGITIGAITGENGILGSIGRIAAETTLNMENCYTAGESQKAIIGTINPSDTTTTNIKNIYYDKSKSASIGVELEGITAIDSIKNNSELVDILNNNIGENTNWNRWKLGEDAYPVFE